MTTACTTYYRHSDIATSGALTHRYYVQDYLGSTRAVVDEDGNVLQSTAYYPSGVPLTPNSLTPQTIKLHTGKDFFDLQGAGWYDNQARYYDCLIPTFKSQDPLAEKYPWLSPYNHCANNPLKFVDTDGLRPTPHEAVLMAKHVYNDKDASKILIELNKCGWKVSSFKTRITKNFTKWSQNGLQSQIYERTIDGKTEYTYAFAGTNSLEDGVEDIAQIIGMSPQYYTAISNAQILSEELGNSELTFVGHSLGGGEAAAASMATQRAAITFNPAAVSKITSFFGKLGSATNVTNYIMVGEQMFNSLNLKFGGDPLNNIQKNIGLNVPGKIIPIKIGYNIQHSIDGFLKLDLPE